MASKRRAPKAHPFSYRDDAFTMSDKLYEKLVDAAGFDPNDEEAEGLGDVILTALNDAINRRNSLDHGPSPAGTIELLKRVESAARELRSALHDLDAGSLSAFVENDSKLIDNQNDNKYDVQPEFHELDRMIEHAQELQAYWREWKRRGRERQDTRSEAIERLAMIFQKYESLSEEESYELSLLGFLRIALTAAEFPVPKERKLRGLVPAEFLSPLSEDDPGAAASGGSPDQPD